MNQHLTVSYLDEAGIELRVDIDVSAATFENNADGGVIKWRNTRTGNQPENSPGGGGGFLSSLVSAATGAAAGRPAHREHPAPGGRARLLLPRRRGARHRARCGRR